MGRCVRTRKITRALAQQLYWLNQGSPLVNYWSSNIRFTAQDSGNIYWDFNKSTTKEVCYQNFFQLINRLENHLSIGDNMNNCTIWNHYHFPRCIISENKGHIINFLESDCIWLDATVPIKNYISKKG